MYIDPGLALRDWRLAKALRVHPDAVICARCSGASIIPTDRNGGTEPCPRCSGSGIIPLSVEIDCRHWAYREGRQAHYVGTSECARLAGSPAWQQWHAGWSDAEMDQRCDDARERAAQAVQESAAG
jgi:hypothetical protein